MDDIQKIFEQVISNLKPFFPFLFLLIIIPFFLKTICNLMCCGYTFSVFDFIAGLIELIFYREKFTCKTYSDNCAVFDDESNIDFGEFSCSEHCEHYGKCVNCMFFDYDEDKYICGKCYHRHELRELKSQVDSDSSNIVE